mmetsp:Transcript_26060/g.42596  ORF Transcript_26060/g.42596 Transcript_26060/m.42596 type:complete len:348 (+) Transcript_26060:24-1067(+)
MAHAQLNRHDLHPTSQEFMEEKFNEHCEFVETYSQIKNDRARLNVTAYDDDTNIEQTVLCLLRMFELDSDCDLEILLPIVLYLQDKHRFDEAYKFSCFALQCDPDQFNAVDLQNDFELEAKCRILYEVHIESMYHLAMYNDVIREISSFQHKYVGVTSARLYHLSFFANVELSNFQAAVSDISISIQLDPSNANLYNHRCFVYCELEQFEDALKDADKCLTIDSSHRVALNNRGSIYNDLGKYELAIIDLDQAIKVSNEESHSYANAYKHRAFSFFKLGQFNEAIADINKAIEINENYSDAKELMQNIYNEHLNAIHDGIDTYCTKHDLLFLEPLLHIIAGYVVGEL